MHAVSPEAPNESKATTNHRRARQKAAAAAVVSFPFLLFLLSFGSCCFGSIVRSCAPRHRRDAAESQAKGSNKIRTRKKGPRCFVPIVQVNTPPHLPPSFPTAPTETPSPR